MTNYSVKINDELSSLLQPIQIILNELGLTGVTLSVTPPTSEFEQDFEIINDDVDEATYYDELGPYVDQEITLTPDTEEPLDLPEYDPTIEPITLNLTVGVIPLSEIVWQIPGIEGISLVLNPSGFNITLMTVDFIPVGIAIEIGFGIRFSRDYFKPMKQEIVHEETVFEEIPENEKPYIQIIIASATLKFDFEGNFDIEGGLGIIVPDLFMIGDTGIILSNLNIVFNLTGEPALKPDNELDGWKGMFISSASLFIPDLFSGEVEISKLGIGEGGISGDISVELEVDVNEAQTEIENADLEVDLFSNSFEGAISDIRITFERWFPSGFEIGGVLKLPVFDKVVDFDLSIDDFTNGISHTKVMIELSGHDGGKIIVFGDPKTEPNKSSFVIQGISAERTTGERDGEIYGIYEISLADSDLTIKPEDNGLLKEILPAEGIVANFGKEEDMVLGYNKYDSIYFKIGSIEIKIPLRKQLGPILLDVIYLTLTTRQDDGQDKTFFGILADLGATIGPASANVQKLGIEIPMYTRDDGNFGPLEIEPPQFKVPEGIYLGFDGNGIRGGGGITISENQYSGVLDLKLTTWGIQAIAVINTKPVFSFIVAIFADLNIQLGAGFVLTKVGGLLGIHRTIDLNTIGSGIQAGILDNLLFPDNVIANASRVIQSYSDAFPVYRNQFLFGPALQIGYSTPPLVTFGLAVIFEFPDPVRLTILGKITAEIPPEVPLLQLNIGIMGVIDFTNKYLAMYGSIYNSKLLVFTLSGDMALSYDWGKEKVFIFSIGGFHPRFTPPDNFPPFGAPALRRMQIAFSSFVTLETYIALTTNTFQIGARIDAKFSGAGAEIHGYLGFDALIQFSPLYYIVEVAAGFSVKFKGHTLANISFSGSLEGPNPHIIKGDASFSILFWDITVNVEKTFGVKKSDVLETHDPWLLLKPEADNNDSWSLLKPSWSEDGIIIREDSRESNYLDPLGSLRFLQNAVPINYFMDWVVTGPPKNYAKFEYRLGMNITFSIVQDYFASAHWGKFSNEEKLSMKSSVLMDAGIDFGTDSDIDFDEDGISRREMIFETSLHAPAIINESASTSFRIHSPPYLPNYIDILLHELASEMYRKVKKDNLPDLYGYGHLDPLIQFADDQYVIVDENLDIIDMEGYNGEYSQLMAEAKLNELQNGNIRVEQEISVVPKFEMEAYRI